MLEIRNDQVVLQVREELGAAISRYSFLDGRAIFRTAAEDSNVPFDMGCIFLIPWCNRVSGGGFHFNDQFYPLASNIEGETAALHGNAFQNVWQCIAQESDSLTLRFDSSELEPFRYRAEVTYTLEGADLLVRLSVNNVGECALPYGVGVHPWFEQDKDTTIHAHAEQVLLNNDQNLPIAQESLSAHPALDFSKAKSVPENGLDNCFTGWNQQAELSWPSRGMKVQIEADTMFTEYHVYSMGREGDFVCFEPVSHPANNHHWPNGSQQGLTVLKPGESIKTHCSFRVHLL